MEGPVAQNETVFESVFEAMTQRLAVLLPPMYRERFDAVAPVSMGSAGLCFDAAGRVAWDRMWGSFCNLAMAGGPPHKGRLLEPATPRQVQQEPERYAAVVAEVVRGIGLAAGLEAAPSTPGWVRLHCANEAMAGWMLRAMVMENVAVRGIGTQLELPAGPAFRLEKEIKNVITVVTKTAHYWQEHMPRREQFAVARLLTHMDAERLLLTTPHTIAPDDVRQQGLRVTIADRAAQIAGLRAGGPAYPGWVGLECRSVETAVGLMRLVVVSNVLARREETVLYLPANPVLDPSGVQAVEALRRAVGYLQRLATAIV